MSYPIVKYHTVTNYDNIYIPFDFIVWHDTGVRGQSARGNANYFYSVFRSASAHYFVDKNEIVEVVPVNRRAWHVGDDKPYDNHDVGDKINNSNSVGIELVAEWDGSFHPETIKRAFWLARKLMKEHKIPASHNVRHYDASGKNCPQELNKDGQWTAWKQFYKDLTKSGPVVNHNSSASKAKVVTVKAGDSLWGISKQYNVTIAQLKEWNKLKGDIIVTGQVLKLEKKVVPPAKPVASHSIVLVEKQTGRFYPNTTIRVRDIPSVTGKEIAKYHNGEYVDYQALHWGNGYIWLEYVRGSGGKGYIPCREYDGTNIGTLWGTVGEINQQKTYIHLASNEPTWNVYALGTSPVKGNQVGILTPSQFNGLTYEILGYENNNQCAIIQTESYGKVKLYITTGASVYTK